MTRSDLAEATLVAVYGYGREGRSLARHVRRLRPEVSLLVLLDGEADEEARQDARELDFHLVTGTRAVEEVLATLDVDLLLRSPGVSLYRSSLQVADDRGVRVTTATNLWLDEHRPDNVIAVTGTKGKSTTTSLVAHLLGAAGRDVALAGNIGLPLLELPRPPSAIDHVVVELSSYQLADLEGRLPVGVWLNLHREHVDWHGDEATYARDKARIVTASEVLVANAADAAVRERSADHPNVLWFDAGADPVRLGSGSLPRDELVDAVAGSRLVGRHHVANLAAALTAVAVVDVDPTTVLPAVATFEPLPHRLQLVDDDGRRWIDDSIATIPEATVAALDAFPSQPVTLLAGGFDRQQNHAPLADRIAERDDVTLVAMPDTGRRLASEVTARTRQVEVLLVDDLAEAVRAADRITPTDGVVLLSPAAPSYGFFRSFEERGAEFARLVRDRIRTDRGTA